MKKIKPIIKVIIFISIVIAIFLLFNQKNINNFEKVDFKSIDIISGEQVYTYDSYIYIYGGAGLRVIKDETVLLEESFSLENPYISTAYDKLAIADKNGKVIRVYSYNGNMYTVNTVNSVVGFSVNKNGYLGIILKNNSNYEIEIYNKNGENIYSVKDISYEQGIPTGISISQDNNIFAVLYTNITAATLDSNVVLYSIEENKLFGGVLKQNEMVGFIRFLNNSNLLCVSDKEIFIVSAKYSASGEQVDEIYQKTFNNVIKDIKFLDGVGYAICYGEPMGQENIVENNTVVIYNQSGGEIGKYYDKEQNISTLYANQLGVVLKEDRLFTAINTSGKKLWEYQATQDIKQVLLYKNDKQAAIVTNDKIKIVKTDKVLLDKQIDDNYIDEQTTGQETANQATSESTTENATNSQATSETTTENATEETTKNTETTSSTEVEVTNENNETKTDTNENNN